MNLLNSANQYIPTEVTLGQLAPHEWLESSEASASLTYEEMQEHLLWARLSQLALANILATSTADVMPGISRNMLQDWLVERLKTKQWGDYHLPMLWYLFALETKPKSSAHTGRPLDERLCNTLTACFMGQDTLGKISVFYLVQRCFGSKAGGWITEKMLWHTLASDKDEDGTLGMSLCSQSASLLAKIYPKDDVLEELKDTHWTQWVMKIQGVIG